VRHHHAEGMILILTTFTLILTTVQCFISKPPTTTRFLHPLKAEDGVSLDSLSDIKGDSLWLSNSVQTWLDNEFIPLDVHKKIGQVSF
jgi:hypothetical protein